jgi:hypothetical protein
MSEWAERIRLTSASYQKGEGWFTFKAKIESQQEFERARGYVENVINAGMKPEILDAIRSESEALELELAHEKQALRVTQIALERALEKLTAWEREFEPLCRTLGIRLPEPYNQDEAKNEER